MPIAIVTGGNSGIGRATVTLFAERGFDIGLTWHSDEENVEETLAECRESGVRAEARLMDLTQGPNATGAIGELIDALGGVDVFVNNAGTGHEDPFLELGLDTFKQTLEVDLIGAFLCAQKAARHMVANGTEGRIINVTSVHEHVPLPQSTAYVVAKHGLGGMTKNMAIELAEHGISVNSVAPGEIATKMTGQEDRDPSESERPAIPLNRPGHAREIASAIVWLASPDARYTTGQSIIVDGGMLQNPAIANLLATA
jgi:NAD(P)-dependent dehydrogenase (short-subunit alcohol dehydrogenase family)